MLSIILIEIQWWSFCRFSFLFFFCYFPIPTAILGTHKIKLYVFLSDSKMKDLSHWCHHDGILATVCACEDTFSHFSNAFYRWQYWCHHCRIIPWLSFTPYNNYVLYCHLFRLKILLQQCFTNFNKSFSLAGSSFFL